MTLTQKFALSELRIARNVITYGSGLPTPAECAQLSAAYRHCVRVFTEKQRLSDQKSHDKPVDF